MSTFGGIKHWTNATGNSNFGTDANWTPTGAPTAADTAVIDSGVGFSAIAGQSNTVARLVIPAGGSLMVRKSDNGKSLTVLHDFVVEAGGTFSRAGGPGTNGPVVSIGGDIINNGLWNISAVGGAGEGVALTGTNQVVRGIGSLTFQNLRCQAGFTIDGTCVTYLGTYAGQPPTMLNGGCFGRGYPIASTAGQNGSLVPAGVTIVSNGGSQTYTISPDPGYTVADVLVDGISVGAVTSYSFTNATANRTISATFALCIFTITATAGVNGSILPSRVSNVSIGGSQNYTITPDPGYRVADVLVDGTSAGAVTGYNFTNVTADHTISATFAPNVHTIAASVTGNGSIAPSGITTVNHNGNQNYIIMPDAGHYTVDVLVDGTSVGPVTGYAFTNVIADHSIVSVFATQPQVSVAMNAGWNLVSVPSIPVSYSADSLFPAAVPNMIYGYQSGSYATTRVLQNGQGYWAAYTSPGRNTITGTPIASVSVTVPTGNRWVLIGSLTSDIPASSLTSNPPEAIVPGSLWGWSSSTYFAPSTLVPGEGYWVFVKVPCTLTLSSGAVPPAGPTMKSQSKKAQPVATKPRDVQKEKTSPQATND